MKIKHYKICPVQEIDNLFGVMHCQYFTGKGEVFSLVDMGTKHNEFRYRIHFKSEMNNHTIGAFKQKNLAIHFLDSFVPRL